LASGVILHTFTSLPSLVLIVFYSISPAILAIGSSSDVKLVVSIRALILNAASPFMPSSYQLALYYISRNEP
jgi:hypothetical protein